MDLRRRLVEATAVIVVLFAVYLVFPYKLIHFKSLDTSIPAIYNFGDSNSDTGSYASALGSLSPPYGNTHFGKPPRRFSDGRLIIDFIAERLKLPYLRAYLDSSNGPADFGHGVNFASAESTVQHLDLLRFNAGCNPLSLDIQVTQFLQFKARTQSNQDITRTLFTIDHGQNDINSALSVNTEEKVIASIPNIIKEFSTALERLYEQGARRFWIHNTGPSGCLPYFLFKNPPEPNNVDPIGCIKSFNMVAQEFNRQLKEKLSEFQKQFIYMTVTYIDMYSIKYALISKGKKLGFRYPLGCCCQTNTGRFGSVTCGDRKAINGEVINVVCSNPSEYISWDSIHYTEAANKWIVNRIFDGSFSEPEFPLLNMKPVAKNHDS